MQYQVSSGSLYEADDDTCFGSVWEADADVWEADAREADAWEADAW